ncbi:MAG: RDD family protein [Brevinema sp.]
MDIHLKSRSLKFAPAWKRAASFIVDSMLLTIFLSVLIALVYGDDISQLYQNVKEYGGLNLMQQEGLFASQIDLLRQSPKNIQDFIYVQNIITTRYYYLIYVYFQVLTIGYFAFFWYVSGQTLGASIFGIRVIQKNTGRITILNALLRSSLLKIYEYLYYVPIFIVVDPMLQQRIHDKLSNTVVIENKDWQDFEEDIQKIIEGQAKKHHDESMPSDRNDADRK